MTGSRRTQSQQDGDYQQDRDGSGRRRGLASACTDTGLPERERLSDYGWTVNVYVFRPLLTTTPAAGVAVASKTAV